MSFFIMFQRGHLSEVQHCNQLWKVETPYRKQTESVVSTRKGEGEVYDL